MSAEAPSRSTQTSFRDPAGRVVAGRGRILRLIKPAGVDVVDGLLASARVQEMFARGRIVRTEVLPPAEGGKALDALGLGAESSQFPMVLEHERVPFPSFPYEWPPELLWEAARLTLDLADDLLADGWGLKDATPYNVLFRGSDAVFVDLLSFERREARDPTWLPYAQFTRTFLLPLLAHREFGLSPDRIFLTNRDGLEPEEMYRLAGRAGRLRPAFLTLVTLPTWLGGRQKKEPTAEIYQPKLLGDPERARFVLRGVLGSLRRKLKRLKPATAQSSTWSGYMTSLDHYSQVQFQAKRDFVERALKEFQPRSVLDVGCNTGHFSVLSAEQGARVVALDYDAVVVGAVARTAQEKKLDILPLVVNLTRPTPAVGWRNQECPSFLDRARGGFEAVLLLAVVHHMLVTERIPLPEIVDLVAEITTDLVVVEWVAPADPMFRRIARGRDSLHVDLTTQVWEAEWRRHFDIVRVDAMGTDTRALYLLRKRGGAVRA